MLCLQGGAEFGAGCRTMDADLLVRAGSAPMVGPVVVAPLAGAPGREYRTAGENGVRHFLSLGARDVSVAPDAREDEEAALAALRRARLLVLPGGSPARLLDVLMSTPVGDALRELHAAGGVVAGSSAGAMVLGQWTVLPDRRGRHGPAVVPGLGLAERLLVIPHWSGGSSRGEWLRAVEQTVPEDVEVVGIPEQSGLLVDGATVAAVGSAGSRLVTRQRELPVGTQVSWDSLPL